MFIPTYGIVLLIRFFAVITKYTVLDEQRREAKEGKSQRKNPRSVTSGAMGDSATLPLRLYTRSTIIIITVLFHLSSETPWIRFLKNTSWHRQCLPNGL